MQLKRIVTKNHVNKVNNKLANSVVISPDRCATVTFEDKVRIIKKQAFT